MMTVMVMMMVVEMVMMMSDDENENDDDENDHQWPPGPKINIRGARLTERDRADRKNIITQAEGAQEWRVKCWE